MWPVRIDPHERVRSDEPNAVFVNVSVCQATAATHATALQQLYLEQTLHKRHLPSTTVTTTAPESDCLLLG